MQVSTKGLMRASLYMVSQAITAENKVPACRAGWYRISSVSQSKEIVDMFGIWPVVFVTLPRRFDGDFIVSGKFSPKFF